MIHSWVIFLFKVWSLGWSSFFFFFGLCKFNCLSTICWKVCFLPLNCFLTVKYQLAYFCGSISGFSALFHWSVYLTLCYYPCLYLNWVVCFLIFEFWEFILYPAHKSFVESVVCEYFLSFCSLSFHDPDSVFLQNKSFKFGWPTIYHFSFFFIFFLL